MHLEEGYKLHNKKYQLLNVIGEGGFSLTYKGIWNTVIQGELGKIPAQVPVCIKEYFLKDYCQRSNDSTEVITSSVNGKEIFEQYKERLVKEAKILSEIHHPNIVSVLEVFNENNTVYIVMEFISGQSLKQKVEKDGVFTEPELLKLIYMMGQALHFIHEKNILHLDIKPANILIDSHKKPILIDFGLSKRYSMADSQETSTSILAISKGYTPIEKYDSEGMQTFSPCPDIYSLGATMYFLLTGQVPTESILRSTRGLKNPTLLNPELSEKTEQVILKAMAIDPDERYQSVMDMIVDLGYNADNDKIESNQSTDNASEHTELLPSNPGKDIFSTHDETVLIQNKSIHQADKKTKKRKSAIIWGAVLASIFIILFVLNSNGLLTVSSASQNEKNYQKHFSLAVEQFSKQNYELAKEEFCKALNYQTEPEAINYIIKIDSLTLLAHHPAAEMPDTTSVKVIPSENPEQTIDEKGETNEDSILKKYNAVLKDAIKLYENKEYLTAKQKFQQALKIKKSNELIKYIDLCNNELEKLSADKRKELYDLKMEFGNFVVARKKSTGLYGTINKDGIETIPCKYKTSYKSGENRAFQRTDNDLYDIYAPSGVLVSEGVGSY